MKQNETYDGEKMYWLTCDHCGDFTLQYETPGKLAYEALGAGWRHDETLEKDFCCRYCELEYLAKLFKKGGVGAADAADGRWTMDDGRCESKAASPQGKGGER